jgi:type II secretory pathway component PulJ
MIFGIGNDNNNNNNNNSDPDILLKMVEELTMAVDDVTPELMNKMEKVEIALASFLDEKSAALQQQQQPQLPPPPLIPPPMGALYRNNDILSNDLIRVEEALEKLRQRLRREEEALFRAEQVLQRSLEEQDILRRAEEALQKSREAAARRKVNATRRNEVTVAAIGRSEQQSQIIVTPERSAQSPKANANDTSSPNVPRPTMELGNFFGRKASDRRLPSAPVGMPILYNWIQEVDGSLRGNVKLSPNFTDGAIISTSAVEGDAQSGTVVTTASGSQ